MDSYLDERSREKEHVMGEKVFHKRKQKKFSGNPGQERKMEAGVTVRQLAVVSLELWLQNHLGSSKMGRNTKDLTQNSKKGRSHN